jgi:RTX calcium-binding nonapeptide repeat (4 copies)
MLLRCLLPALAVATLSAPVASAATVRADGYESCGDQDGCPLVVSFRAAPSETNTVSVSAVGPDGGYVVSDSTAPLSAGDNCIQTGVATARCALAGGTPGTFAGVYVRLGDGDDALAAAERAIGFGGPGADTLLGGPGRDVFVGGPGKDALRGDDGDDSLDGDGGATERFDDLLDGGAGTDQVTYRDRERPVSADLSAGRAGSPGEHDRLVAVENLEGGLRDNSLTGDAGPNVLQAPATSRPIRGSARLAGGGGDDRLFGGPRSDAIAGGPGDDTVDGGVGTRPDELSGDEGDDAITGSDGADRISGGSGGDAIVPRLAHRLQRRGAPGDRIACGAGTDSVDHPYPRALVRRSCERVTVRHARLGRPRRAGPRVVKVAATFIKARSTASPCALFIELRTPRTRVPLGHSQRSRWRDGARVTFRVRLTAAGVRTLRSGGPPVVAWITSLHTCRPPDPLREGFSFRP